MLYTRKATQTIIAHVKETHSGLIHILARGGRGGSRRSSRGGSRRSLAPPRVYKGTCVHLTAHDQLPAKRLRQQLRASGQLLRLSWLQRAWVSFS